MKEKSLVSRSVFEQKVKQLKKEQHLKHHEALNEASKFFGFPNYKNYLNESKHFKEEMSARLQAGFDLAMDEKYDKMADRHSEVNYLFDSYQLPIAEYLKQFGERKHSDEEIQSICEKDMRFVEFLSLFFHQDSLALESDWDFDDIGWYHIPKKAWVHFLKFKYGKDHFDNPTDANVLFVEGDFEILCENMFEHTPEDKANNEEFFAEGTMTGSFELTIDQYKNVTLDWVI